VLDSSRREADRSTHADDLLALESVAALHPDVATFETWLRGLLERRPAEGPAVLLSTIHKIKGREWDHVVLYGVSAGLLPHRLSDDEEGERRVFHVALTRAVRQVLILADADEPSPFVAELDGSRPHNQSVLATRARRSPEPAPSGRSAASKSKPGDRSESSRSVPRHGTRSSSRPAATAPAVAAEVGLVIDYGGHTGAVVDLTDAAAVIRVGDAQLKVPFGSDVRVEGLTVMLGAPSGEPGAQQSAQAFEGALRGWRSEAAKRATVPAYVVLNDSELVGIASRRPTTLAELARCKGMGPIRLERWGDELLAVLNGVEDDSLAPESTPGS
jgi:DNA helicase II / ATP-dependent DNA helicase PcrA